jgi:hypothetical protein
MQKGTHGKSGHYPNVYPQYSWGGYGSSGVIFVDNRGAERGLSTSSRLRPGQRPALLNGERDYFPIHPTSSPNDFIRKVQHSPVIRYTIGILAAWIVWILFKLFLWR